MRGSRTMTKRLAILLAVIALLLAACGGGSGVLDPEDRPGGGTEGPVGAGDPVQGAQVYSSTCSACHGPNFEGIDGLGKQLVPNEFVQVNTEEELADFLAVGRSAGDPLNETGVDMPPRGGNPSLTDQDLRNVAAYLQAQQP